MSKEQTEYILRPVWLALVGAYILDFGQLAAKIIVDYEFYPGRCHHVVDAVARQRRFGRNVCGPALQYCQYGGNHLGRVFHHYAHGFLARRYFGEYCLGHLVELRICDRAVVANHGSDPGLGNGEIMKM